MIGTRPEAIKLAPVAHALAKRGIGPRLVLTGQHRDLEPADFGLGGFPAERLGCPGKQDPHRHVGVVTAAMLPSLGEAPGLLLVECDTSSSIWAALAAFTGG